MQTVTCRSAAGIAPAQTVIPTIAAITVTPVIYIASSSYADAGGGGREKRPWPWYFRLGDCGHAGSIRGNHWFTESLERRRPSSAGAAGGPGVQRAASHSRSLYAE